MKDNDDEVLLPSFTSQISQLKWWVGGSKGESMGCPFFWISQIALSAVKSRWARSCWHRAERDL
jgi:hypothetical protein